MASAVANFSDETKRVIETMRLEQAGSSDELQASLNDLAALQVLAKAQSTKFAAISGFCFVAAIVFVIVYRNWLGGLICGAAVIFSLKQLIHWKRLAISQFRCQLANQVVQLVARDSDPETPINLAVDFSKATAKQFRFSKPRQLGGRSYFNANWLSVRGRFADGTRYSILLNELTVIKHRKGKLRPKDTELTLLLAYPEKTYGAVSQLSDHLAGAVSLPKGTRIKTLRLVKNRFRLTVSVPPIGWRPLTNAYMYAGQSSASYNDHVYKVITMMLLSAYQVLNLGRTMSK